MKPFSILEIQRDHFFKTMVHLTIQANLESDAFERDSWFIREAALIAKSNNSLVWGNDIKTRFKRAYAGLRQLVRPVPYDC